jgi:uncharacterized protein (TIGR03067 family)
MQSLIAPVAFAFAVAVAFVAERPSPDRPRVPDDKKAAAALEGGYTIVSGEQDGKPIPAERIKGSVVRFTGDKIIGTGKDMKEFFSATFTLDSSKSPWVINMKTAAPKESETVGLVRKDGDTLTIIYALPGGEKPTEFKTKAGQQLFVLKSVGKDK